MTSMLRANEHTLQFAERPLQDDCAAANGVTLSIASHCKQDVGLAERIDVDSEMAFGRIEVAPEIGTLR